MANYRFQVTLASLSGLSEDRITNVFHATATSDANAESFADTLAAIYSSDSGGVTNGLTEYFGASVSRAADSGTIKVYDLGDAPPRAVVVEVPFTPQAQLAGSDSYPREVAAVLSFQGDPLSGTPQARRRGRVYFGPLNTGATVVNGTTGEVQLDPTFIDDLALVGQLLIANTNSVWSVWSPTSSAMVEVTNGWVDNACDTQRRRGQDPTTRTVWTAL